MNLTEDRPVNQARTPAAPSFLPAPNDARQWIRLPGPNWLISDFGEQLGHTLATKGVEVFSRAGGVWTPNAEGDGIEQMTPDRFRTWIENHIIPYREHSRGEGQPAFQAGKTMSLADATAVLVSPQFHATLPTLARFHPVRMPALLSDVNRIVLLPTGYHADSQTYTAEGPAIIEDMPLEDAKNIINDLLREFTFIDDRSRAVAVAGMLTVYASGILPPRAERPCFAFLANAEGAGKSLLVKIATVPVLGSSPASAKPKDEDEMRKFLFTAARAAKTVIVLDNIKGRIESAALEMFLTADTVNDRVLGHNREESARNLATVFLTGNACTVSPDMRRRSLFCELLMEHERAEDKQIQRPLGTDALLDARMEILSALWSLVRHWQDVMPSPPKASRSHSSFPAWTDTIAAIVEFAGFGCPVETPKLELAGGDTDLEDMKALAAAMLETDDELPGQSVERAMPFAELVKICQAKGLFSWLVPEDEDLDRKAKSSLGKKLNSYSRRLLGDVRFLVEGDGHKRRYHARRELHGHMV